MKTLFKQILRNALHCDWHLHDVYSHDGSGYPVDFALKAREKGITSIAITNHVEVFNPKRQRYEVILPRDIIRLEKSRASVIEARKQVPEVEIKFGVEVENNTPFYPEMQEILNTFNFDFVIGSAHLVNSIPITSEHCCDFLKKHPPMEIYRKYYEEVAGLVEWGRFDILGHVDIIRRYMVALYPDVKPPVPYDTLRNIFTLMKSRGQGIEINTGGLFQAPRDTYPTREIIETALACGIERLIIGSDAHSPEEVGRGFEAVQREFLGE